MSAEDWPKLLRSVVEGAQALEAGGAARGERGMVHGRRTSTPASRRAPVDLDILVLTDRRTGVLAKLMKWSQRVRVERKIPEITVSVGNGWSAVAPPSIEREAALLGDHWPWISRQPWFQELLDDLADLLDLLSNGGRPVPMRPCPACGVPIRLDRIADEIIDHLDCLPPGAVV